MFLESCPLNHSRHTLALCEIRFGNLDTPHWATARVARTKRIPTWKESCPRSRILPYNEPHERGHASKLKKPHDNISRCADLNVEAWFQRCIIRREIPCKAFPTRETIHAATCDDNEELVCRVMYRRIHRNVDKGLTRHSHYTQNALALGNKNCTRPGLQPLRGARKTARGVPSPLSLPKEGKQVDENLFRMIPTTSDETGKNKSVE